MLKDGQTDMRKLVLSFRTFAKVPKKLVHLIEISVGYFRCSIHNIW
jgi:hypothetical protein